MSRCKYDEISDQVEEGLRFLLLEVELKLGFDALVINNLERS